MNVNFGGMEPMSCSDFPGNAAMAIFLRGCSQGCPWCHNASIQGGENLIPIETIYKLIDEATGRPALISAIVISGGEPAEQPEATAAIADYARSKGLAVALHTSGLPKKNFIKLISQTKFEFILIGGPGYDPRKVPPATEKLMSY